MKKQILSFKNAFRGVWSTIKTESHMRFHMVAAFYVIVFSFFYNFTAVQWALLIITISLVPAFEIINTCIEQLCNLYTDRYEPKVKFIKDAAAGAVLISAIASAAIAVIFFFNKNVILNIVDFYLNNPALLVLLLISAVISVIFICIGPVGIKNLLHKN